MSYDKFIEKFFDPENDDGFNEVVFQRNEKKKALRERLKKYRLDDKELDDLFKIIVDAEIAMEKVKRKYKGDDYTVAELNKFKKQMTDLQEKMKKDFEKKLADTLQKKFEKAKKFMDEYNKKNPFGM